MGLDLRQPLQETYTLGHSLKIPADSCHFIQSVAKTKGITRDYQLQQGTELVELIIFLAVSNMLRKRDGKNRRTATEKFKNACGMKRTLCVKWTSASLGS